jgi:hypothetical protein
MFLGCGYLNKRIRTKSGIGKCHRMAEEFMLIGARRCSSRTRGPGLRVRDDVATSACKL